MINSGVENIQEALLSPEAQKQLQPTGPRVVHHSTKARKTIDTENTDLKYSAKPDGTLVTEKIQTTEHEEFCDDELPEKDDHSTGSRERVEHKVSEKIVFLRILFRRQNKCLQNLLFSTPLFTVWAFCVLSSSNEKKTGIHATIFETS